MKSTDQGMLLRIFIGESDLYKGKPLYEQIILKAKELKLAGATAIHGIMGFGVDSRMHTAKILRLSENLPVIVEIIDAEDNINKLIPFLDDTVKEGLITLEKVKVIKYRYS